MSYAKESVIQRRIIEPWIDQGGTCTEEEIRPSWYLLRFYYDQVQKYPTPDAIIYHFTQTDKTLIEYIPDNVKDYVEGFCKRYDNGEYDKIDEEE